MFNGSQMVSKVVDHMLILVINSVYNSMSCTIFVGATPNSSQLERTHINDHFVIYEIGSNCLIPPY